MESKVDVKFSVWKGMWSDNFMNFPMENEMENKNKMKWE